MANVTPDRDSQERAINLVALAIIASDDCVDGQEAAQPDSTPFWLLDCDPEKMEKFLGWLKHSTGLDLSRCDNLRNRSVWDFAERVQEHLKAHPNQVISPAPLPEMQWAAEHNIGVGGQPVLVPSQPPALDAPLAL